MYSIAILNSNKYIWKKKTCKNCQLMKQNASLGRHQAGFEALELHF